MFNRYTFFVEFIRYQAELKICRLLSYSTYAVLTSYWTSIVFGFSSETGYAYLIAGFVNAFLTFIGAKNIVVVLFSTMPFYVLRFMWSSSGIISPGQKLPSSPPCLPE